MRRSNSVTINRIALIEEDNGEILNIITLSNDEEEMMNLLKLSVEIILLIATEAKVGMLLSLCCKGLNEMLDNKYWWSRFREDLFPENYDPECRYKERYRLLSISSRRITIFNHVGTEDEMRMFLHRRIVSGGNLDSFISNCSQSNSGMKLLSTLIESNAIDREEDPESIYESLLQMIWMSCSLKDRKGIISVTPIVSNCVKKLPRDKSINQMNIIIRELFNNAPPSSEAEITDFLRAIPVDILFSRFIGHYCDLYEPHPIHRILPSIMSSEERRVFLMERLDSLMPMQQVYHLREFIKLVNRDDVLAKEMIDSFSRFNDEKLLCEIEERVKKGMNINYIDSNGNSFLFKLAVEIRNRGLRFSALSRTNSMISGFQFGLISVITGKDLYDCSLNSMLDLPLPGHIPLDVNYVGKDGKNCIYHMIRNQGRRLITILESLKKGEVNLNGCLHQAIKQSSSLRVIQLILKAGADRDEIIKGKKPIEYLRGKIDLLMKFDGRAMEKLETQGSSVYEIRALRLHTYQDILALLLEQ